MISDKLGCIFIHIPKTAGHSVDVFFQRRGLVSEERWHATASEIMASMGHDAYYGYFSFSIIRNPWDRFVSEYIWQRSNSASQIKTPWGNKQITFREFCMSDCAWYPEIEIANGHLADQAHFLLNDHGDFVVKRIIRFERLQPDFAEVCEHLGLSDCCLPHLNSTTHDPYWKYYDDNLVELVAARFAKDIELFGYKFGK